MAEPPYVVRLSGTTAKGEPVHGTGIIATPDGVVLTCWHVVRDMGDVTVALPSQPPAIYAAKEQLGAIDLAVIRPAVPLRDLPFATPDWNWATHVKPGDAVDVWGFSAQVFGNAPQFIGASVRQFDSEGGSIGITGAINFGDSGGAALVGGRLIGIIYAKDKVKASVALAFPVTRVPREILHSSKMPPLPVVRSDFVGRGADVRGALDALATRRVVTLLGLGGIGKSECARAVAREAVGEAWAADGVAYIDLQSAASPTVLQEQIRVPLGLGTQLSGAALGGELRGRRLYVLDDVHQALANDVRGTRALLRALLEHSDPARFLLTNRTEVGLSDEKRLRIGRLAPPHDQLLFRKLADGDGYQWQAGDDKMLEGFLADLDGYPLAINIAANLLHDLPLKRVVERWQKKRTEALRIPGSSADSVHHLLELAYNDLDEDAKTLFACFSLVPAGGALELFDAMWDDNDASAPLQELLRRSLIGETDGRYTMLVPVREFAVGTLTDDVRNRVVPRIDQHLRDRPVTTPEALSVELPNIHAALDRAMQRADHQLVADLTVAIREYYLAALTKESQRRLEAGVDAAVAVGDLAAEASLRTTLSSVYWVTDKMAKSRAAVKRALDLFRQLGDEKGEADALWSLAGIHWMDDKSPDARRLNEEALAIYERIGHVPGQATAIQSIGDVELQLARAGGDDDLPREKQHLDEALRLYRQSLDLYTQAGDGPGIAAAQRRLGDVSHELEDYPAAHAHYTEALRLFEKFGPPMGVAAAIYGLGQNAVKESNYPEAERLLTEAKERYLRLDDRFDAAAATWKLSEVAEERRDRPAAIALMEEVAAIYREIESDELANATKRLDELRQAGP